MCHCFQHVPSQKLHRRESSDAEEIISFCLWSEVGVKLHSFPCGSSVIKEFFVVKTILYTLYDLGTLVENKLFIDI